MASIRACSARDYPLFIQNGADGKFIGFFGSLANDAIGYIEKATNLTVEVRSENDGLGGLVDPATDMWDGCIGRIQRNESDMLFQLGDYPHPASNLNQGLVLGESVINFIAAYTFTNDLKMVQIESLFGSFSPSVWLLCFMTLLSGYCFLLLGRFLFWLVKESNDELLERRQSYKRPFYQVITHLTDYGQLADPPSASSIVLNLALSLFPLLVIFHLCSFIKTELVAVRPPSTFRSYRDLLDNNVSLAIPRGWDHRYRFELAPRGSEQRALWDLSLRRHPQMEFLFSVDLHILSMVEDMVARKAALITDSFFATGMMRDLCLFSFQRGTEEVVRTLTGLTDFTVNSIFPLCGRDESEKATLKGLIFSDHFANSVLKKFRAGVIVYFETGLVEKALSIIDQADTTTLLPTTSQKKEQLSGQVEECAHNVLYEPQIVIESVGFVNIRTLLIMILLMYLISFYFFLCEVNLASRRKEKRAKQRARSC